jgi:hypothetical protein
MIEVAKKTACAGGRGGAPLACVRGGDGVHSTLCGGAQAEGFSHRDERQPAKKALEGPRTVHADVAVAVGVMEAADGGTVGGAVLGEEAQEVCAGRRGRVGGGESVIQDSGKQ